MWEDAEGFEERFISSERIASDGEEENILRPKTMDDYVGQEKVKENLKVYIEAAKKRGEALDHLKDDKALVKELRERAKLYIRAYRDLYGVQARPRMMLGVYDTNGANFGQIAI